MLTFVMQGNVYEYSMCFITSLVEIDDGIKAVHLFGGGGLIGVLMAFLTGAFFSQAPEGFPDVLRTFRIPKKAPPPLEVAKTVGNLETGPKDEKKERGIWDQRLLSGIPINPHVVELEIRNSDGQCWTGTDLKGELHVHCS